MRALPMIPPIDWTRKKAESIRPKAPAATMRSTSPAKTGSPSERMSLIPRRII